MDCVSETSGRAFLLRGHTKCQVSTTDWPLVVLFGKHGANQVAYRRPVGEGAHMKCNRHIAGQFCVGCFSSR